MIVDTRERALTTLVDVLACSIAVVDEESKSRRISMMSSVMLAAHFRKDVVDLQMSKTTGLGSSSVTRLIGWFE